MKAIRKGRRSLICLVLSFFLVFQTLSAAGFVSHAEEAGPTKVTMTEGEVKKEFIPAGVAATSEDPAIAWVDGEGNLRAMKPGSVRISTEEEEYTVFVDDYSDGTEIVGNLKLLVRYNDSMPFYDGHDYLLFTSYKDGVSIEVPDLYAGYTISDQYYADIREDISYGSNHTGNDPSDYFTLTEGMTGITLNRGEIVTIGMYRAFDLSIKDTILNMLQNSTLWTEITEAGKTAVIRIILAALAEKPNDAMSELEELKSVLNKENLDIMKLLDGVTDGGVCFNRELYNQKLEWDQYENVTYEMDITERQLELLTEGLQGNLNKFSLLKNDCTSVATRAWNLAVGTRDGEDTSYKLDPTGTGIFSIMDAPKGIRDDVIENLPGYYMNNSNGVEEPDAGFQDDTGWVYVSAPKKLEYETGPDYSLHTEVVETEGSKGKVALFDEAGQELDGDPIAPGTKIYVSAKGTETILYACELAEIRLNGESILKEENYDSEKDAYFFTMPERETWLKIIFSGISVGSDKHIVLQLPVGAELNVSEYAYMKREDGYITTDDLTWETSILTESGVAEVKEGSDGRILEIKKAGESLVFVKYRDYDYHGIAFVIQAVDDIEDYAAVTFDEYNSDFILTETTDGSSIPLLFSGFMVKKGTELTIEPMQEEPKVISSVKVNGRKVKASGKIIVNEDTDIKVEFGQAEVTGLPRTVRLERKGDIYQLNAKVTGSGTLYDTSLRYESSDPLVEVNSFGRILVKGDVPEDGKAVIVTAYAGSSNDKVSASCKVVIGNYSGEKIVGQLTIYGRPSGKGQLVPHGSTTFTAYEDMDLQASYYAYYKPEDKFTELIMDYDKDPEKYTSDPALYDPDLDLGDRESYFKEITNDSHSQAETIQLKKGETITFTNYSYDDSNLVTLYRAIRGSAMYYYVPDLRTFADELQKYLNGEEIDDVEAFNSMMKSAVVMYTMTRSLGKNPINGESEGGLVINREIYKQFRGNDSQTPNYYYSVELTADEYAMLQEYTSNPDNNYYSLFTKNCATGAVDAWNAALSDRPELQIKGSLSSLAVEPEALSLEIKQLGKKVYEGDTAGKDYYPRSRFEIPEDEKEEEEEQEEEKGDDKDKKKYSEEWIKGRWYNKNGTQTYKGIGKWVKEGSNWKYVDSLGWTAKNCWQKIDSKWYFFDKNGYLEMGTYRQGYYLTRGGAWDGKNAVPGWKEDKTGWKYVLAGGKTLAKQWMKIDGNWYYFHANGYAAHDEFVQGWWIESNCVQRDPVQCSWHKTAKGWWYGSDSWYAKSRSYTIDGKKYNFDAEGYCTNP